MRFHTPTIFEDVYINVHTGLRIGVEPTNEQRGTDKIYDPWLRIPDKEVHLQARGLLALYNSGHHQDVIAAVNTGGLNHVNRILFQLLGQALDAIAPLVDAQCTQAVRILFDQSYAHRLYDRKVVDGCLQRLHSSITLAKAMPHPSWDKWVTSGYFFLARYSTSREDKARYCIASLLEPRDLSSLSPHMKFWKCFRAAAWLIGNNIDSPEAKTALDRYIALNFRGYYEHRDPHSYASDTCGSKRCKQCGEQVCGHKTYILNDPAACLGIMHNGIPSHTQGNP